MICAKVIDTKVVRRTSTNEKTETKMEGFTLNHANSAKVNLITMKRLIDGELEEGQKPDEVPHICGNHLIFVKKAAISPLFSL